MSPGGCITLADFHTNLLFCLRAEVGITPAKCSETLLSRGVQATLFLAILV